MSYLLRQLETQECRSECKRHDEEGKAKAASVSLMRKAIRLFNSEYVSYEVNRANRVAWLCAVKRLGERWVLANPVKRGV